MCSWPRGWKVYGRRQGLGQTWLKMKMKMLIIW
jgi:hypothetical protein